MNFSNQLISEIEEEFQKSLLVFGVFKDSILNNLSLCSHPEQLLMKFLYSSMAYNDIADYDFSLYLKYVDHSLFLREHMEWCRKIPERIFLNYIVYHRINSENIMDCRKFFYDMLLPRINGKTMEEAVIEINYWCAENVLYKASDFRTAAPLTVFHSGTGRCGEESTFTVTALRSVGIPARQVYTPRWAHCDDNHAWVEVWCDGSWHFFGACEPEEILDSGWFTNSASRALIIHSRNFSSIRQEDVISKEGLITYINHTDLYARTKKILITVTDAAGNPIENAKVQFEILNQSEYFAGATVYSDAHGTASITVGLGDIHLHVSKADKYADVLLKTTETDQLTVNLDQPQPRKEQWLEYDIRAPKPYPMHQAVMSPEQKETNRLRLEQCDRLRGEKLENSYKSELAELQEEAKDYLKAARGNFDEVYDFVSKDSNPYRQKLLKELVPKDYFDLKADILEEHLAWALKVKGQIEEDIFCKYVLSPRISYEYLTPYRKFISEYFSPAEIDTFKKNPGNIWYYINNNIKPVKDRDYSLLIISPAGALKLKTANELSRKILFVAICRTLGIPARLNPVDNIPQYDTGTGFVNAFETEKANTRTAALKLTSSDISQMRYYQTWTIGKLQDNKFETLDYTEALPDGQPAILSLEPGDYRIITVNRLASGDMLAAEYHFTLQNKDDKELLLYFREQKPGIATGPDLPKLSFTDKTGKITTTDHIVTDRNSLLIWLEEGKEPTEHLLSEMLMLKEADPFQGTDINLIIRSENSLANKTLSQTLLKIPDIHLYLDFDGNVQKVASQLQFEPDKLPYVVAVNDQKKVIYTSCGYNVGVVEQMKKAVRQL